VICGKQEPDRYLKYYRRVLNTSQHYTAILETSCTLPPCMSFYGTAVSISRTSLSIDTILIH